MLFLSYAEEDAAMAAQVSRSLRDRGYAVYDWQASERRGGQFILEIESAMQQAVDFVALLSPSFMASPWCQMERQLAVRREQDLRVQGRTDPFVHVLRITNGNYADAGFLQVYDWVDLRPANWNDALGTLFLRLRPPVAGEHVENAEATHPEVTIEPPVFRNREDELDRVLRGVTNAAGPHFWLVIAPPQLGKTWFLTRISAKLAAGPGWATRVVDLREQPAAVRQDAQAILGLLFEPEPTAGVPGTPLELAIRIADAGRSHLCLVDSAELLDGPTARRLRALVSEIYHQVERHGPSGVHVGFIVASRREDDWRGVTPGPRLTPLPLTEFKTEVVQRALRDLATQMKRNIDPDAFDGYAASVHRLTAGLPALLVLCLQWIRGQQWFGMERLDTGEMFTELAQPYIQGELLAEQSVMPLAANGDSKGLGVLRNALRVLAPYRLFTQSHLRHHLDDDPGFARAVADAGWPLEDLWTAISDTALLVRPLDEPWQQIYPAIRRLLYHYHYQSAESCAEAHGHARKFVEVWADRQVGKEQVIGLVECLWHEAIALSITEPARLARGLSESAARLSAALTPSAAYTCEELRQYAAERLRSDEEFHEAIDHSADLLETVAGIVTAPAQ